MELRTIGSTLLQLSPAAGVSATPQKAAPEAVAGYISRARYQPDEMASVLQMKPNVEDVAKAVKHISDVLEKSPSDLRFEVDDDIGELVVKMINRQTGEVIRQFPSETALEITKTLNSLAGHFISAKA